MFKEYSNYFTTTIIVAVLINPNFLHFYIIFVEFNSIIAKISIIILPANYSNYFFQAFLIKKKKNISRI